MSIAAAAFLMCVFGVAVNVALLLRLRRRLNAAASLVEQATRTSWRAIEQDRRATQRYDRAGQMLAANMQARRSARSRLNQAKELRRHWAEKEVKTAETLHQVERRHLDDSRELRRLMYEPGDN